MAYSDIQRTFSVQSHETYIDGVPFKITEPFLPPKSVTLPDRLQLHPRGRFHETYDFRLEEQVIDWANAYEKQKQDEAEAKLNQSAATQADNSDSSSIDEDSDTSAPVNTAGAAAVSSGGVDEMPCTKAHPSLSYFGSNGILTPVQAPKAETSTNGVSQSTDTVLDLTLFERENDPFESVSLKTIDDLAELKNVLQPQSTLTPTTNQTLSNGKASDDMTSQEVGIDTRNHTASFNNISSNEGAEKNEQRKKPKPIPRKHVLPPIADKQCLLGKADLPARPPPYASLSNGDINVPKPSKEQQQKNMYSRHAIDTTELAAVGDSVDSVASGGPLGIDLGLPPPYTEETIPKQVIFGSGIKARGIPLPGMADISPRRKSGEFGRSPTPPLRPSSSQFLDNFSESWNRYAPLPPSPAMQDSDSYQEPDPYYDLTQTQKEQVDSMICMGFPKTRVIRLVQKFEEEQKVLDMLCLINQMLEKGFNGGDAEAALLLYDSDEEKATQYLEAMGQFRNMGFPDDSIKEALMESNLDAEQALDFLTA